MHPKITILNAPPEAHILAVRAAGKFMKERPNRESGVRNLVGFGYEDGSTFAVWWTAARNVTVYYEGQQ